MNLPRPPLLSEPPATRRASSPWRPARLGDELLKRELAVLSLVAGGLTNQEIGAALLLGENTVKTYLQRLLTKLGARNRTHLVVIALQVGLLELGRYPVAEVVWRRHVEERVREEGRG